LQFPSTGLLNLQPKQLQAEAGGGAAVENVEVERLMLLLGLAGSIWSNRQAVRTRSGERRWFLKRGYSDRPGAKLDEPEPPAGALTKDQSRSRWSRAGLAGSGLRPALARSWSGATAWAAHCKRSAFEPNGQSFAGGPKALGMVRLGPADAQLSCVALS